MQGGVGPGELAAKARSGNAVAWDWGRQRLWPDLAEAIGLPLPLLKSSLIRSCSPMRPLRAVSAIFWSSTGSFYRWMKQCWLPLKGSARQAFTTWIRVKAAAWPSAGI